MKRDRELQRNGEVSKIRDGDEKVKSTSKRASIKRQGADWLEQRRSSLRAYVEGKGKEKRGPEKRNTIGKRKGGIQELRQ